MELGQLWLIIDRLHICLNNYSPVVEDMMDHSEKVKQPHLIVVHKVQQLHSTAVNISAQSAIINAI